MRDGNVTGSVNAPEPAFASPLPSMIEPAQSTVTVRENVAILISLSKCENVNFQTANLQPPTPTWELEFRSWELTSDLPEPEPRVPNPALLFPLGRNPHLRDDPKRAQHEQADQVPLRRRQRVERIHPIDAACRDVGRGPVAKQRRSADDGGL